MSSADNGKSSISTSILIPKARVGVVIGKKGETKKRIEEELGVRLEIDSTSGEVKIFADPENADALLKAVDVIKAIGRGFSPENALLLKNDEYTMTIIDLTEYARNKNALERVRARIIGRKGKARLLIEEITGTKISVYGKTVSIIGEWDKVPLAEEAVRKIAAGSPHSRVYDWLYEQKKWEQLEKFEKF
ncbi:MAG: KH domain-containing protein [Candidatus Njordarchaeia archaeon]